MSSVDRVDSVQTVACYIPKEIPDKPIQPGYLRNLFLMTNSFETGGSERQFVALANSLDRSKFKVSLGCVRRRGAFSEAVGEVPEFRLWGSAYGWKSWKTRIQLAKHLHGEKTQIAHAFDFYTNLTLIPAAKFARIPVIIGSQRQLGDLLTPTQERVQSAMFRLCDAVVCNSRAAADLLIAKGISDSKIIVIENGLPREAFSDVTPALPPGRIRVGMIARMNTRSKNHNLFLAMATRLRNRFPDVEFVLVGDGPLRAELEQEAKKLSIADRVTFLGDRRDIRAILASLQVSVLPSASESLSNVILESMAGGIPVVANKVGGNPELLGDERGILVKPDDTEAFGVAVARLLGDAQLRVEIGRRGREFAETHFTIENMRKRYEDLYAALLNHKKWSPRQLLSPARGKQKLLAPVRVAIVAASLRYVGGQSAQADLLIRNWQDDPTVDARLIPIDPRLPGGLGWVERVPGLRTVARQPFYLWQLWRGLRDADLAHIFSASYWSFLIAPMPAWLIARLHGKKTIIHYHSGEARDHLTRFRSARPMLAKAGKLVVPSEYLVDVFQEFGLKAEAVPNTLHAAQFPFRLRKALQPRLVCTRGFHPYYMVDVVVRAFALIKQAFPAARLDLVGGGPLETEIRNLVQQLRLQDVNFAGIASREDISRHYQHADIFINASRLDNMPVSILEAFGSGTPVISTDAEGIRYLVKHERTGLLSPVGDHQALANNVIRILNDNDLAVNLAVQAYEESQQYQWPVVREQWLRIYGGLLPGDLQADQELRPCA
jgi:glycosyltransferase involved in cell wall biosynthesis